ncbi:hypothetical protein GCM10023258_00890 [Terrabacter aeriphilus]|uniref:Alpha/beta hydrolase family protein n=1 Tax=Terrabacter aeriphilus TaxID=515662 RepID=A0ABP9J1H1_9MICO
MTTSRYADGALLLPSPLLPGHVMDDLAVSLGRAGLPATVAAPDLAPGEGPPDLVDRWARQVRSGTVVVAHSNAGYLAPHVRRAAGTGGPVVFVDAALPPPSGHHRLAPPALRSWLGELAEDEGLLPPWTRWWPREDLEQALPTGQFDDLDRTCPRLPLRWFDTTLTAPPGWAAEPDAYLAFGTTYADERAFAARRGWPVADLDGGHLHLLAEPDAVADAVLALVAQLSRGAGAPTPPPRQHTE